MFSSVFFVATFTAIFGISLIASPANGEEAPASAHAPDENQDTGVVYSKVWSTDSASDSTGAPASESVQEQGALSVDVLQRVGRPWSHFDEDTLYHEHAWSVSHDGQRVEHGYQISSGPNPTPVRSEETSGPPAVAASLRQGPNLAANARFAFNVKLRNFPEWDLPLRLRDFDLDEAELAANNRQRQAAKERRAQLLDSRIVDLVASVERSGGEVLYRYPSVGWVTVEGSAAVLDSLSRRTDLERIEPTDGDVVDLGMPLGEIRWPSRADSDRFLNQGYTGEGANPDRHGFHDLVVAVVEAGLFEDEACAFYDGADCTGASRIQERFLCTDADNDGNFCEPVTNFAEDDEGVHGTVVASTILADYMDDQACGFEVGDGDWGGGCHDSAWENLATGMAPEAKLIFFGGLKKGKVANSFEDAFDDAIDRHVDAINNSWGWGSSASNCNPKPIQIFEEELENAFDDGIFVVTSAGNSCGAKASSCNIGSPADTIKSFTVNALDTSTADCMTDYHGRCLLDPLFSAKGGADVLVDGVLRKGALTGIDLIAASRFSASTSAGGDRGTVSGGEFRGTSAAAPVVTGLAILAKDWMLQNSQPWINFPGRLHTLMLAMSDRHYANDPASSVATTQQKTVRGDHLYGFGRVKMRLLDPGGGFSSWGNSFITRSFTAGSSSYSYVPFKKPMPKSTALLKCVMMQSEDLSSKDDISNLDLEMRIHEPVGGTCDQLGASVATRIDDSFDVKSMTALEASATTQLAGMCPAITIRKQHVTNAGITSHVMCYFTDKSDDE